MPEGLTIFAHLDSRETEGVAAHLGRRGLWDHSAMVYDCDSSLLMTLTDRAKAVVMEVMAEMDLLPKGETTFHRSVS